MILPAKTCIPTHLQSTSKRFFSNSVSSFPLGPLLNPRKTLPSLGLEPFPGLLLILGSLGRKRLASVDTVDRIVPSGQSQKGRRGSEVGLGGVGTLFENRASISQHRTEIAL
jgi:hypothetical protein